MSLLGKNDFNGKGSGYCEFIEALTLVFRVFSADLVIFQGCAYILRFHIVE